MTYSDLSHKFGDSQQHETQQYVGFAQHSTEEVHGIRGNSSFEFVVAAQHQLVK